MTTLVGYLITFLYILMVMFVSMVLESDSYDKESRRQKNIISVCWILLAPIAIIYLIIMIIKNKL